MTIGRKTLLPILAALCGLAWGQTNLTTIQDTLFRADGTRFTGTLTIQWSTFDSSGLGTVVQQSETVQVLNGNLDTLLAPNAGAQPPADSYNVVYQSDGREQFAETWTVPVSVRPLKVAEVRTGMLNASVSSSSGSVGNQTPITEATVVGLQADLNQRPVKGAGYGTNGVAIVDDNGVIQTAAGNVGDCVLVDGTTGPCGAPPVFADAETPGGLVDGTNATFTLANTPLGASLMMFRNGIYLTTAFDYALTGSSIQFVSGAVPQPGDTVTASYRVDPSTVGNIGALSAGGSVVHSAPAQVICSASGTGTASGTWTSLGGCDIPSAGLHAGDRIEVQFTFSHSGTASGFDLQANWGSTTILSRHGATQDSAVAGRADAAITTTGAQITLESWGTVLPFLPGILTSPVQSGVHIALSGRVSTAGSDHIAVVNYTVIRFPAN